MVWACCCAIAAATTAAAAQAPDKKSDPFAILDNSFLVEEAFNQEAHVFQNILNVQRTGASDLNFTFTQEWPLGSIKHQLSYTVALANQVVSGEREFSRGAMALNYRFQLANETTSAPAISPRLSLLFPPAGDGNKLGLQLNVPASKQFGDFYVHLNAGYTINNLGSSSALDRQRTAAASLIYRVLPMFNLMLESTFATHQYAFESSWYLSPGFRVGKNIGKKQVVFGLAVPMGLLDLDDKHSLFGYLSYELPF